MINRSSLFAMPTAKYLYANKNEGNTLVVRPQSLQRTR